MRFGECDAIEKGGVNLDNAVPTSLCCYIDDISSRALKDVFSGRRDLVHFAVSCIGSAQTSSNGRSTSACKLPSWVCRTFPLVIKYATSFTCIYC